MSSVEKYYKISPLTLNSLRHTRKTSLPRDNTTVSPSTLDITSPPTLDITSSPDIMSLSSPDGTTPPLSTPTPINTPLPLLARSSTPMRQRVRDKRNIQTPPQANGIELITNQTNTDFVPLTLDDLSHMASIISPFVSLVCDISVRKLSQEEILDIIVFNKESDQEKQTSQNQDLNPNQINNGKPLITDSAGSSFIDKREKCHCTKDKLCGEAEMLLERDVKQRQDQDERGQDQDEQQQHRSKNMSIFHSLLKRGGFRQSNVTGQFTVNTEQEERAIRAILPPPKPAANKVRPDWRQTPKLLSYEQDRCRAKKHDKVFYSNEHSATFPAAVFDYQFKKFKCMKTQTCQALANYERVSGGKIFIMPRLSTGVNGIYAKMTTLEQYIAKEGVRVDALGVAADFMDVCKTVLQELSSRMIDDKATNVTSLQLFQILFVVPPEIPLTTTPIKMYRRGAGAVATTKRKKIIALGLTVQAGDKIHSSDVLSLMWPLRGKFVIPPEHCGLLVNVKEKTNIGLVDSGFCTLQMLRDTTSDEGCMRSVLPLGGDFVSRVKRHHNHKVLAYLFIVRFKQIDIDEY